MLTHSTNLPDQKPPDPIRISVVIPTFNRAPRLREALEGFARAEHPAGLDITVIVVDNNSNDGTRELVVELRPQFLKKKLEYIFEPRQGRSFALNTGIAAADCDLLSTFDDDEIITPNWFVEVEKVFRERWAELDFLGGKILPNWEIEPPSWVEPLKVGALCVRDFGDEEWTYTHESPILTGGIGVFKSSIFDDLGGYEESIGARGKELISGEDEVFYDLLMKAGKIGIYDPDLVIYHYVPAYRLDKTYYRSWLFGVGISRHLADISYKDFDGAKLLGVPRWMYRTAAAGVIEKIKYTLRRQETEALAAENQPLVFAGYFYGRNLHKSWADGFIRAVTSRFVKQPSR